MYMSGNRTSMQYKVSSKVTVAKIVCMENNASHPLNCFMEIEYRKISDMKIYFFLYQNLALNI